MSRIAVSVDIDASVETVWADVADLASHAIWMADAESVEFLTDRHSGVGTRMKVATKVGPFRTADVMEVTAWEPPTTIEVIHQGLVTGTGAFILTPHGNHTRFTWSEMLSFPCRLGGPITALAARPILTAIWRHNLHRLKSRIEAA